jgi:hypothetical protein
MPESHCLVGKGAAGACVQYSTTRIAEAVMEVAKQADIPCEVTVILQAACILTQSDWINLPIEEIRLDP